MIPSAVAATNGGKPDPGERGHEVDQQKREGRHQPEEQEIAESVLAKTLGELGLRAGRRAARGARRSAVLAIRKMMVAPMVAPTTDASPPTIDAEQDSARDCQHDRAGD